MRNQGHFVKSPCGNILEFQSDKAFREWANANHDTMLLRYITAEKQEWWDVSYWKYEVIE